MALTHNSNTATVSAVGNLAFVPARTTHGTGRAFEGTHLTLFSLAYQFLFRIAFFARQLNY
jgi:hypothetical protein